MRAALVLVALASVWAQTTAGPVTQIVTGGTAKVTGGTSVVSHSGTPIVSGGTTVIGGGGGVSPSTYTFVTYTSVLENAGPGTSITSPALTLSTADFVTVYCRVLTSTANAGMVTFSSSPSNTMVSLPQQIVGTNTTGALGYILSAAAGSTTFTCSFPSGNYFSITVLQYHHSGSTAAFDTQIGAVTPGGTTITSGSFTTTGTPGLVVMCASVNATGVWTAGTIGGLPATLRGVSAASLASSADAGCEDRILSTPQTGITATLNTPNSGGIYTLGVWK